MASAELSRRVEKVVGYSRSPTASRASRGLADISIRNCFRSRGVHTWAKCISAGNPVAFERPRWRKIATTLSRRVAQLLELRFPFLPRLAPVCEELHSALDARIGLRLGPAANIAMSHTKSG